MYRKRANIEAETANAPSCTPAKEGLLNSPSGSIRAATRRPTTKNAVISTAAPANRETITVLPHPSSLPRTSASTSRNSAPLKVATPAQSIRVALGSALAQLQVGDGDRRHAD